MHGEPIEAVRNGMQMLVSTLRTDPYALETAFLSVVIFDEKARQVVSLTELMAFQPPTIEAGSTTSLGDALKVLTSSSPFRARRMSERHRSSHRRRGACSQVGSFPAGSQEKMGRKT